MVLVGSLLTSFPYIDFPYQLLGWIGWLFFAGLVIFGAWRYHKPGFFQSYQKWIILTGLLILVPFTTLFIGIRFPREIAIPVPGMPLELRAPVLMFFSAIPWVLAGGMIGPGAAVLVAVASGLVNAIWETHSLFTPLEIGGLALIYSLMIRQPYRTKLFRFLRHPIGACIVAPVLYAPVIILSALFAIHGDLAVRLDYALTQSWATMLAGACELIIASLFAEILIKAKFKYWISQANLVPSPFESYLSWRLLSGTIPFMALAFLALVVGDWIGAGRAAQKMIEDRLSSTAKVAANSLPYFLESGQNLILSVATQELAVLPAGQINEALSSRLRIVPYFRKFLLYDAQGELTGQYPPDSLESIKLAPEEEAGVHLALDGVLVQTYTIPPEAGVETAEISFLASIQDVSESTIGVLVGRTDLETNPFTQPAIQALATVQAQGGEGMILDEKNTILYHTTPSMVMTSYLGTIPDSAGFFEETSSVGTRQYVYYQPVTGRPWSVIVNYPASIAQKMALNIAVPLLLLAFLFLAIAIIFWQLLIRRVTVSIQELSREVTLIAQGKLDHPLKIDRADEIGNFAQAFEQMRASLKARLDELGSLLIVSQGVAASLDAGEAMRPVLQAAMGETGMLARVVLFHQPALDSSSGKLISFGVGSFSDENAYLDQQLFNLAREQKIIAIPNTVRLRRIQFEPGKQPLGAIIALALHREQKFHGVLWVAYERPHAFSAEEERFLSTLAGQAAIAAANVELYNNAEIGRQRMEAVLNSTPDPVLVIDEQMRLLLMNPAAMQVPGLITDNKPGNPIKEVIALPSLLDLISQPMDDRLVTREIPISNNKNFYVSISPVKSKDLSVGKICVLQDITYFKELDKVKSEFVSTVSHDLRSPLTLMRGYATMVEMVGELNDQQKNYMRRIVLGVENMNRLVNNLLDLGRIETGIGLKPTKVASSEIVENVISLLTPQANQKNLELVSGSPISKAVIFEADPALLQQSLVNLVENAIKYTPVGGRVEINVELKEKTIVFKVTDNGIGIAPLDLPHMFEKFYRSGRREAYQQRGSGLGLAIVKSIAERHGGRVWVESQLGKGSTFYVEIPFQGVKSLDSGE